MTRHTIIIFYLTILTIISYGQDTIWIQEGDKSMMVLNESTWIFKNNLKDGNYVSFLKEDGHIYITNFASFKNYKKNGCENMYISWTKNKYAEINWSNGLKNGNEIYFDDGTLKELFTFKNNTLNGQYIKSYGKGFIIEKGYYKNAYRDSIWSYFKYKQMDSLSIWKYKECKYKNGESILISAWTEDGKQTVSDGKGIEINSDYITTTTEYIHGQKNGLQLAKRPNGNFIYEKYYANDLLIKAILYNDNNKISYIKEWSYPSVPRIDTILLPLGNSISDIVSFEITREYTPTPNGKWTAFYHDGTIIFDGNFANGKRTGNWVWNYSSGKKRIIADYSTNLWQHFDTTGAIVSEFNNEYLTFLTNYWWYLDTKFGNQTIQLTRNNKKNTKPRLIFHYDGQLEINSYLTCNKLTHQTLNLYSLSADELIFNITNKGHKKTIYFYKISFATDDLIILKRQK